MSNFNFSASATYCNAENLLVILRPELAVAYAHGGASDFLDDRQAFRPALVAPSMLAYVPAIQKNMITL
jgi:hypothetical protein